MSWTTDGVERLWMSPLSHPGQPGPLRGGVPVLFPQFGTFGSLAKHGFARTADWQQVAAAGPADHACLAFELTDSEWTRAIWPHSFCLRVEIAASATELRMGLLVDNLSHEVIRFTGGLHTYLAVDDAEATIDGLQGAHVWDGHSATAPQFPDRIDGPVRALAAADLVVRGAVAPVVLRDRVRGDVHVAARGFPNRVIWNPGPGHGLDDVAPGDEARFVCIEPAAVSSVVVPGTGTWEGRMRLFLD